MNMFLLPIIGVVLTAFSGGSSDVVTENDVATLTKRSADANAALVKGDIDTYLTLIKHAPDYTLMAPVWGSASTRLR